MRESLEKLMKGEPIAKGDFKSTQDFMIDLMCQSDRARGRGETYIFELENTYIDILNTKLPHMIEEWTRKLHKGKTELNFEAFEEFVLGVARIDERIES
jgi:hypothetical protein